MHFKKKKISLLLSIKFDGCRRTLRGILNAMFPQEVPHNVVLHHITTKVREYFLAFSYFTHAGISGDCRRILTTRVWQRDVYRSLENMTCLSNTVFNVNKTQQICHHRIINNFNPIHSFIIMLRLHFNPCKTPTGRFFFLT